MRKFGILTRNNDGDSGGVNDRSVSNKGCEIEDAIVFEINILRAPILPLGVCASEELRLRTVRTMKDER